MSKQWKKSLDQSDIVADKQPFDGADIDASISSRATQSDILSDGTPFDGANIDQPISEAGGGVDWASKTPAYDSAIVEGVSDSTETILSVSGSGYILNITGFADTTNGSNTQFVLDVDTTERIRQNIQGEFGVNKGTVDNVIFDDTDTVQAYVHDFDVLYRFDSGFTVKGDESAGASTDFATQVSYVLD